MVTLAAYAKHMLKYQDGWFGRHPLFHYYLFNWIMKEQVLNTTNFLYNQFIKSGLFVTNELINEVSQLLVLVGLAAQQIRDIVTGQVQASHE